MATLSNKENLLQQDRQCTYNVTLRRFRATIVGVERKWVLHNLSVCICSFRYPAFNAHAPFCHLLPASLCSFFYNTSQTTRFSKKKKWQHKMCFDFLYKFCLENLSFWEVMRDIWSKIDIGLHVKHPLFLSNFNETWIFSKYFRKILKLQISLTFSRLIIYIYIYILPNR